MSVFGTVLCLTSCRIEQLSNSAVDLEAEEQRCMAEVVAVQRKRVSAVAKRAVLLTVRLLYEAVCTVWCVEYCTSFVAYVCICY